MVFLFSFGQYVTSLVYNEVSCTHFNIWMVCTCSCTCYLLLLFLVLIFFYVMDFPFIHFYRDNWTSLHREHLLVPEGIFSLAIPAIQLKYTQHRIRYIQCLALNV